MARPTRLLGALHFTPAEKLLLGLFIAQVIADALWWILH